MITEHLISDQTIAEAALLRQIAKETRAEAKDYTEHEHGPYEAAAAGCLERADRLDALADKIEATPARTLRDDFAAKALAGWLASCGEDEKPNPKRFAEFAYEIADAMLEARK